MMFTKACYTKCYDALENSYQIGDFDINEHQMHCIYDEFKASKILLKDFAVAIILQKYFPCETMMENYFRGYDKLKLLSDSLSELKELDEQIFCSQNPKRKNIDYLIQQKKFALEKFEQHRATAIIAHFDNQKLSIEKCASQAIEIFEKNHDVCNDVMRDKKREQKLKDKKNK